MAAEPQLNIDTPPVVGLVLMGSLYINTSGSVLPTHTNGTVKASNIDIFYKPSDQIPKLYDRNADFLGYLWFIEKTDSVTHIEVVKGVDGMNKIYVIDRILGDPLPALAQTNKNVTTATPSYNQLTALDSKNNGGMKWYWWVGGGIAALGVVIAIVATMGNVSNEKMDSRNHSNKKKQG
jgi:hypothetical protein